jgi:hypothetical protein
MYKYFIKRPFKDIDKVSFEINVTWNLYFTGHIKLNMKLKVFRCECQEVYNGVEYKHQQFWKILQNCEKRLLVSSSLVARNEIFRLILDCCS